MVARYRKRNPDFDAVFDLQFWLFIIERHRDPTLLAKAELVYRVRLAQSEKTLSPNDQWLAMETLTLAQLLSEIGKHAEAEGFYKLAQQHWELVTEVESERKKEALEAIRKGLQPHVEPA